MPDHPLLYVGLMSGTSVDGVDSVLVEAGNHHFQLLATREHAMPDTLRAEIAAVSAPGEDSVARTARLDLALGELFAAATNALLAQAGVAAADVAAIGSHGQTVRHQPPGEEPGYTVQLGDPNTIVERTGITTVADFRRRDMASGGQGAPLAPAFHAARFAKPGINRAIVNIGGIANVSLLEGERLVQGFDSGPGNTLLDHWHARHRDEHYDRDGRWAASGTATPALLDAMLLDPYFDRSGPRSTGKEHFNLAWLQAILDRCGDTDPADVQATLVELTARTIAAAIRGAPSRVAEVYVCGGGAHNAHLMRRLAAQLDGASLDTTTALGLPPDWVEAAAFAWLAQRRLAGEPGNAAAVTGAAGPRILGGVYQP